MRLRRLTALALAALVVAAGVPAAGVTVGTGAASNASTGGGDGGSGASGDTAPSFPVEVPGGLAGGVAADGEQIYAVVDAGETEEVVKIDPATEEVVERYTLPTGRASGLALNGSTLWAVDLNSDAVMRIDTGTGQAEVAFEATGAPSGVAVANGSLWIGDLAADKVFEFGVDGEYRGQFAVDDGSRSVRSLTAAAGTLWLGDADDEVSPPGLTELTTDGAVVQRVNTSTANTAITDTRWGLLAPTDGGDIRVAIDTAAPVADAGGNRSVTERAPVGLDGTGSSLGVGGDLSFDWTQTRGPSVELRNASTPTPEFTAPAVDGNATLVFELNVSDGNGNFDTDTAAVSVVDLGETGSRADDGSVFTAGQTNQVDVTVESDLRVTVRDTVPAEWTVYTGENSGVDRVVTDEARGVKYVYLDGTARNETTFTYFVEAPDATGRYTFGPAAVRATGFDGPTGWVALDATDTNTVVGADQDTVSGADGGPDTGTALTGAADRSERRHGDRLHGVPGGE